MKEEQELMNLLAFSCGGGRQFYPCATISASPAVALPMVLAANATLIFKKAACCHFTKH
jgi:hypothetical protein